MAIRPSYARLSGMRGQIGDAVFDRGREQWAFEGFGDVSQLGAPAWLKKIGGAAKAVGKGALTVGKFVGKTAANAALNKVGLGPIFTDQKNQQLVVSGEQGNVTIGPAPKNYLPWIIGGGVGVVALVLLLRKK